MTVSFKICVLRHQRHKDKTFPLNIRIGWQSKYAFLQTKFVVSPEDLTRTLAVKNEKLKDKCNVLVKEYREIVDEIENIEERSVQEIKEYILHKTSHKSGIDFMKFSKGIIDSMKKEKAPSYPLYNTTYNHLKNYIKSESLLINKITPNFLNEFENYLAEKEVGSRGLNLYLGKIRALYNKCMDEYEHLGYTFSYPFRKYKLPTVKNRKTVALERDVLLKIINHKPTKELEKRAQVLFYVSLLTLGTNAKDLFLLGKIDERIEYNRSKTKEKRSDDAFISIKIEPELKSLLEEYKGSGEFAFCFNEWYKNSQQLNKAISNGLRSIAKELEIPEFEYYDARRTIASVMRNKLKISKDDIALCLNHVDTNHKMTDIYIETDFSILDKCNQKFIDWLFGKKSKTTQTKKSCLKN